MKDIKNYERLYGVTKDGRVWSHTNDDFLSPWKNKNKNDYLRVTLSKDNRTIHKLVHRLVLETFSPNEDNTLCCNHKDGNKLNNHITNLEWVTHSENDKHAFTIGLKSQKGENHSRSKLTENDVIKIRNLLNEGNLTQKDISKMFGVSSRAIRSIKTGRSWRHVK